jgi:hypothetical protein
MTEVIQPELLVCSEAEYSLHLNVLLKELMARIPLIFDVLAPWRAPESAMQKAVVKRYQLRTSFGVSAKASDSRRAHHQLRDKDGESLQGQTYSCWWVHPEVPTWWDRRCAWVDWVARRSNSSIAEAPDEYLSTPNNAL